MNARQPLARGVGIAALAALAMTVPTLAQDTEGGWDGYTLPGSLCQPEADDDAEVDREYGSFLNDDDKELTATCPVLNDHIDGSRIDIAVYVLDRNEDEQVCCHARSRTLRGRGEVSYSGGKCTTGSGSTPQVLSLSLSDDSDSYIYIICDLPGKDRAESAIVGMKVREG